MKTRCNNPNAPPFRLYGGRGIKVCDEWLHDFPAFRDWALNNGYSDELTIDRIDNSRGYSPDNCRWTTYKVQANNNRHNVTVTVNGQTGTISEMCERHGIENPHLIYDRITRLGWSAERAFTTPPRKITKGSIQI